MSGSRDRQYWRSLEQLADDPRCREFLEGEFAPGADEPPQGISRRNLLTLLGASLSMAGLAGCRRPVEKIVPYVDPPPEIVPGIPLRYATTMPLGLDACGLVVESHEGRPTKIEGNPEHPASRGGTSARIQASILDLYDPDRSQTVRAGGRARSWADFTAAWSELEATHLGDGGAGLAVVTESFCSPTLARLANLFRRRFPRAHFSVFEPVSDENIYRGIERATGKPYQWVYHFDRAEVVLSIDADFLLGESGSVRNARDWADSRRVEDTSSPMSRLWVVEGNHSLTGANADHRLRLQTGRLGALVAMLGRAVGGGESPDLPGVDGRWVRALVADLEQHRGSGLIVAGRRQPPQVHAAVFALNAKLGNIGTTVTYHALADDARPDADGFEALVEEMRGGAVSTLVVLGGNPVYNAPADLDFEAALGQVAHVIHLASHVDETSLLAEWHVPQAHYLEGWGDARAFGGQLSVTQPLIEPLFGGKSAVEMLGLLATGEDRPGHAIVRETWDGLLGGKARTWTGAGCSTTACSRAAPCPSCLRRSRVIRCTRWPGCPTAARRRRTTWRSCSSPHRRCSTDVTPTTRGCRSCPMR